MASVCACASGSTKHCDGSSSNSLHARAARSEEGVLGKSAMPQPIRKPCHMELSGLTQRPQHAVVIGHIVGISGRLENSLGWLMAFLSQGSATITMAMFNSVS